MTTKFEEFCGRKAAQFGEKWDPSDLDARFIEHFNSGRRISVLWAGEWKRGTVGVTTGWKPCFLLMQRRDSTGSYITLTGKLVDEIRLEHRGHPGREGNAEHFRG